MYVLMVTNGYPTEKYKGIGIFEFDQAKALVKAGNKVVFAAVDVRSVRRWRKWGIERHELEGVHVYVINIPVGKIPLSWLLKISVLGLNYLYKNIIKEFGKPDILHAHFLEMGYVAAKLKQKINVPLVITEHSSRLVSHTEIEKEIYEIADIAYKQANAVIAVSTTLANVIERNFSCKPVYVPNIVDTSLFKYSSENSAPEISHQTFNFVSTGNLIHLKRMDLTIEAFKNAFYDCSDVTLTIFGEGSERAKLEAKIKEYNLGSKVKLMGMRSRAEISEKLKKCDCFVLASQYETFGVAYIEALACGVPVIATKCGGPESFVHKGNGVLISIDDGEALEGAMKYMYVNIIQFDNENISKEVNNTFTPIIIANQLIKIYTNIIIKESEKL